MAHLEQWLINHPVVMLAAIITLEQTGIPIASAPMLVLMGSFIGTGRVNTPMAFFVAVVAGVFVDCQWFELGRIRKRNPGRLYKKLHSASSTSIRIEHLFARHRGVAMFVARLIPGPNFAASLAGFADISRVRFVLLDIAVSATWTSIYLAAGYFLPRQLLAWVWSRMTVLPPWVIVLLLGFAAVILATLRVRRHVSLRDIPRLSNGAANVAGPILKQAKIAHPSQEAASILHDAEHDCGSGDECGVGGQRIDRDKYFRDRGVLTPER